MVALAPRLRESFKHRLMTIVDERVLLIEDDSRLAAMVDEYLGKAGFHVLHAGRDADGVAHVWLERRRRLDVERVPAGGGIQFAE